MIRSRAVFRGALSVAFAALGACASSIEDLGRPPLMTPVGSGLHAVAEPIPTAFPGPGIGSFHSLWNPSGGDLFRDSRASRIGDVVTVNIQIDDKAQFDNATDRLRNAKTRIGFDLGLQLRGLAANGAGDLTTRSDSSTEGRGSIDRSEKLRLSVAAVVTDVLPNGNLLISGSQEVRVNYEVRVLNVAGVIRPRDVSRRNTISYDKIAEARISYGGRGRLMDVQQPAWGQQLYDAVKPF